MRNQSYLLREFPLPLVVGACFALSWARPAPEQCRALLLAPSDATASGVGLARLAACFIHGKGLAAFSRLLPSAAAEAAVTPFLHHPSMQSAKIFERNRGGRSLHSRFGTTGRWSSLCRLWSLPLHRFALPAPQRFCLP